VSNVVADHLVLLDHLRSILVAVGEAEQNDEPFDWNQEKQLLAMPQDQSKH